MPTSVVVTFILFIVIVSIPVTGRIVIICHFIHTYMSDFRNLYMSHVYCYILSPGSYPSLIILSFTGHRSRVRPGEIHKRFRFGHVDVDAGSLFGTAKWRDDR